ncbi:MAG TPA: hypothetical protein VFU28_04815 [Vicinamibacterales bacterium]|nr:hypothetical protein [Vicinamibacterales bacterium]
MDVRPLFHKLAGPFVTVIANRERAAETQQQLAAMLEQRAAEAEQRAVVLEQRVLQARRELELDRQNSISEFAEKLESVQDPATRRLLRALIVQTLAPRR